MSLSTSSRDLNVSCACGELCGTALAVSRASAARVVCYCDDCQAFAHFLGRPDVMDGQGGTEIVALAPARLRLTGGLDTLACVRLSDKGMHRWYCSSCKTPLANTGGPRVPFVGVIGSFLAPASVGAERDQLLGKPLARIKTEFAVGARAIESSRAATVRAALHTVGLLARWWVTGAASPSPFYDELTRAPRVRPRVLTPNERLALRAGADR